jgi:tetratricopeptide (TPR) repeat protein
MEVTEAELAAAEAAAEPEAVVEPEAAVEPEAVVEPEAAVEPEAVVEPEAAAEPEAPVQVGAASAGSGDSPSATFTERHKRAAELVDEGRYYQRTGNNRMAALRYEQAVELMPRYKRALLALVNASMRLSDAQKAVAAAEQLVKAYPVDALHHRLLGDACKRAGQMERARKAWQTAADSGDPVAPSRLQ